MSASYVLRDLEPADLPEIERFWVAAWNATGLPIDFHARVEWLRDHLRDFAGKGVRIIVGLDRGGGAVGFVTIDSTAGRLDQLCVASSEQGQGLARALMNEAKRQAPAAIALDVNTDNPRAVRFYLAEGFRVVGRSSNPMSGLSTLRMEWSTTPEPTPAA